jgi:DNA repair protein SbcC/Rad50
LRAHSVEIVGAYPFPNKVTLDLDALPALVAVIGPNGAGKSTLADVIMGGPWGIFPYRSKVPLHENFITPGGYVNIWSEDGKLYKSEVKVDPRKRDSKGDLWEISPGLPKPRHIAGPLIKDFRRGVEKEAGPIDLQLASAYSVQKGSGSFLNMRPAERRELLTELLNLQIYPAYLDFIKEQIKSTDVELAAVRTRMTDLEAVVVRRPVIMLQQDEVARQLEEVVSRRAGFVAERAVVIEEKERAGLALAALEPLSRQRQQAVEDLALIGPRLADLQARKKNNESVLADRRAILAAVARAEGVKADLAGLTPLENEKSSLEADLRALEGNYRTTQDRITAAREVMKEAEAIRKASIEEEAIRERLQSLDREIEVARTQHQRNFEAASQRTLKRLEISAEIEAAVSRRGEITKGIADMQRRAAFVDQVPCHGEAEYAGCPALQDAQTAGADGKKLHESLLDVIALIEALERRLDEHPEITVPPDLSIELSKERATLALTMAGLAPIVRRAALLVRAESELAGLLEEEVGVSSALDAKRKRIAEIGAALTGKPALEKELVDLAPKLKREAILQTAAARIDDLNKQIVREEQDKFARETLIETLDAQLGVRGALKTKIEEAIETEQMVSQVIDKYTVQLDGLNKQQAVLDEQHAATVKAEKEYDDLMVRHQPVLDDLSDWQILAKACAASGIPTFRIDQALPEISDTATAMLRECYGPVFTIKLTTQRESADGSKLLEDMTATITRGDDEIDAGVLSGGEQVLVSESISLGLALYRSSRSTRRVEVLLRDEVGAPLDPERAPAYVRLLRRAAALGGFKHVLFVTHQPACMDLADAKILVEAGTITVS